MKRIVASVIVVSAVALAAGPTSLMPHQKNTLSPIDQVPTKPQIDLAFGSSARDTLAAIATDSMDTTGDAVAFRLRAIHALAKYCDSTPCAANDLAHQSVASVITATRTATSGSSVLLLRAAIETLGSMKVATDVTTLVPLLDHPSRDVRAATARALRDLCNPQAKPNLTNRYNNELTNQVKLAISEALRILEQCSN